MSTPPPVLVRDFCATDVSAANALTNHYIEHTAVHFGTRSERDEDFFAYWEKNSRRFPWLVAEIDGHFAGYCKAGMWRDRDAYARTVETGIYVTLEAQGRRVATVMYRALFQKLLVMDFHTVIAGIVLPNEPSVRLHESVGFRKVGVFGEVGYKFDRWHDVGFWQVRLADVCAR
jgi:L-amino acid N-acyltransferase YncA